MTTPLSTDERWTVLDEIPGKLQAEIVRGLLEAQGIAVHLTQEGAGRALGLTVAPLGVVQVLVQQKEYSAVKKIYTDFLDGVYEDTEFAEDGED